MPKVTIYTQAYNPGSYLEQCIQSVLNQTYTDFEWLLIDHGSTDDTRQVIQRYAERDQRIVPVYIDVNGSVPDIFFGTVRRYGTGKYLTHLDSDDWWDLDFLEHIVPFAEENDLDLAMTGAFRFYQKQGVSRVMRKLDAPEILTLDEFAQNYERVGSFAGALWGTLKVTEKFLPLECEPEQAVIGERKLNWRSDTLIMLSYVERCRRIGVNEYASCHYRIHDTTLSRCYSDSYFESNIYLYQRLEEFFNRHDLLDNMKDYLKTRYFYELSSTLEVLKNTRLSADEKVRVYARIASHPLTINAFPCDCAERASCLAYLREGVGEVVRSGQLTEVDALREMLRLLAPACWEAVTPAGLALYAREGDLLSILLQNDRNHLAQRLLELIETEAQPERFDLGVMLRSVLPEDSPLRRVEALSFYKDHTDLTRLILNGGYLTALDQMTELLFGETPVKSEEAFLQLYLTLAALESQVSAFLFGKLRLAELCQREQRLAECRAILAELEEMGAELPGMAELKEACNREASL